MNLLYLMAISMLTQINKNILMIAYHFPPVSGSSGVQRTLSFANHLAQAGWKPTILTVKPCAYRSMDHGQIKDIDPRINILRTTALDASRHLSISGRYPKMLALPDSWSSWALSGLVTGLQAIRREKPSVIWSTYPIATAHLLASMLASISGLPWVADFRDSMTDDKYPSDQATRKTYQWIEKRTLTSSACSVFTAPGSLQMYKDRYPDLDSNKFQLIENGYEERYFTPPPHPPDTKSSIRRPLQLLHSGIVYESERDPTALFHAIKELKRDGISSEDLHILFRASGARTVFEKQVSSLGIQDIIGFEDGIDYRSALQEMMTIDGLLVLQASNCNHQIPAKLYEYIRAQKPIIGLADLNGDTAAVVRRTGTPYMSNLDDVQGIKTVLANFINDVKCGRHLCNNSDEIIRNSSRSIRAAELAVILEKLAL